MIGGHSFLGALVFGWSFLMGEKVLMFQRILVMTTLVSVFLVGVASGEPLDDLKRDFKSLTGVVIMPAGNEFLVDLDAEQGLAVGDLMAVVEPGEKIIHPVTKEVLGTLDARKGLFKVTRIKSGYSYVKALDDASGIVRGDTIRRYSNMSATFWDYSGRGETFFAQLQQALPSLEWQDYPSAQAARPQIPSAPASGAPALVFVLQDDLLQVRDAGFEPLRSYSLSGGETTVPLERAALVATPAISTSVSTASTDSTAGSALEQRLEALEKKQLQMSTALKGSGTVQTPAPYTLEAPAPTTKTGGVRYSSTFPSFKSIGNLDSTTTMADFIQEGDRLLLAATDGAAIEIFAVDEALVPVAKGDTTLPGQILSVQWWQPEAKGPVYLAVTSAREIGAYSATVEKTMRGAIFALEGDRLIQVAQGLPYILGTFDLDRDGRSETLLGQSFDIDIFFGGMVKELKLVGSEVKAVELNTELPPGFPVQGSLFADLTGDGRSEAIFVRNGLLYIYAGTKLLYKSSKQMGGSLSQVTYNTNPGAKDSLFTTEALEVPPVAADLDGDGQLELLAVASDRSLFRTPGIDPGVKKSWLSVVKYRDNIFVKGTLGEELEHPVQGVAVEGSRVLFVVSELASRLGEGAVSHVLSFPLAR